MDHVRVQFADEPTQRADRRQVAPWGDLAAQRSHEAEGYARGGASCGKAACPGSRRGVGSSRHGDAPTGSRHGTGQSQHIALCAAQVGLGNDEEKAAFGIH